MVQRLCLFYSMGKQETKKLKIGGGAGWSVGV